MKSAPPAECVLHWWRKQDPGANACILAHDVHIIMLASATGELSEAASTVTGGSCPLTAGAREESGLGGQ